MAMQKEPSDRTPDQVIHDWENATTDTKANTETVRRLTRRHSRRKRRPDPILPERALVVDSLRRRRAPQLLVSAGEIVVRREDEARAAPRLGARGFLPQAVSCPNADGAVELPVVVFAKPGAKAAEVAAAVDELLDDPDVTARVNASFNHVLPDGKVKNGLGGAAYVAQEPARAPEVDPDAGAGVQVAVIDTGIADEVTMRGDGYLDGIRPTPDNADGLRVINQTETPKSEDLDLGAGHGTFVAGVIRQIAPKADVRVYRALDSDGIGTEVGVACALLRAWRDGATIINLSLGQESYRDRPPVALQAALELIPDDVIVVASAGNLERNVDEEEATRPHWPAAFRRVVAVAALRRDGTPASWSQRGHWVDVSVRAENVISTYVKGQPAPPPGSPPAQGWPYNDDTPWAMWSGTSFAAPQVTGMIAAAIPTPSISQRVDPRPALASILGRAVWHANKYGLILRSPLMG